MSKLVDNITSQVTGKRYLVDSPIYVDAQVSHAQPETADEYRVEVRIGTKIIVRPDYLEVKEQAVLHAVRGIQEAVFGEFRKPLYLLKRALYERNYGDALKLVENIEDEMFKI